jgi:hypothetical protein
MTHAARGESSGSCWATRGAGAAPLSCAANQINLQLRRGHASSAHAERLDDADLPLLGFEQGLYLRQPYGNQLHHGEISGGQTVSGEAFEARGAGYSVRQFTIS